MVEIADDRPVGDDRSDDGKDDDVEKNENLTAEFIEEIKDVFDMYDKEKNQTIEVGSLDKVLQGLTFNPTESELREYAMEFDKNKTNQISLKKVLIICNRKVLEPDTIDETIEALKLFDHDKDGKIEVSELRWAMTKLGDPLDDALIDGMINELDPEKTGFVDIMALAKCTHNVKEEKEKGEKGHKGKDNGKKK